MVTAITGTVHHDLGCHTSSSDCHAEGAPIEYPAEAAEFQGRKTPPEDLVICNRAQAGGHSGQVSPIEPSTSSTKHIFDDGDRLVRGDTRRRILPSDQDRALAGVGIGVVLCPSVLFAFMDGTGLEQDRTGPSLDRPEGGPFLPHQHRSRLPCRRETNPSGPLIVPAANTRQGFRIAVAASFPPVP